MAKYPKVLVIALGRINAKDSYNNGLFLRNLFGNELPRDNVAQIFSSGDNGDSGFFGNYYCLGSCDRIFGGIFYRLKPTTKEYFPNLTIKPNKNETNRVMDWFKRKVNEYFVDTGLYELIFRPKLSKEMMAWVNDFNPDIILAQGYNLTFTWLPLMLKRKTGAKLAVLTTDDWPSYLYSGMLAESVIFRWMIRPVVNRAAQRFFSNADIPFAFGSPMAEEYKSRYGRDFLVINHADDPARFIAAVPRRIRKEGLTIVAMGTFNQYRLPLLLDANRACEVLNRIGFDVRLLVISSFIATDGYNDLLASKYIDILPDPGNDQLPSFLIGADAFLLAEGFDPGFVSAIELSISTKAHLFMFSKKPIVVCADGRTGISQYAKKFAWAAVVSKRDVGELVKVFTAIFSDVNYSKSLVDKGIEISGEFHTHTSNRSKFIQALS